MPSGLGSRSIIVVRQADEKLAVSKNFKIRQLQFKSKFLHPNRYIWPVFERNGYFQTWEAIYSMSIPTIKYYRT